MSFKFSDIFKYFQYLPYIDGIVAIVEDIKDDDPPRKKVADVVKDVLAVVVPLVKSNNPRLAVDFDSANELINKALDSWQSQEQLPPTEETPPTGTSGDPTANRYSSQVDAQANATPLYPLVLRYPDGKYGVWPVLSLPAGAVQVN